MDPSQRILGLAGSLRRHSLNRSLLKAAQELAPQGMVIEIFDRLREIPPYDEDAREIARPEPVDALTEAIRAADGFLVVTPEYNYSVPGVLKNAIDWVSRPPQTSPLKQKPAAIMSASTGISGGMRAQYHLRQTFVFTDTPAMLKPEVILPLAAQRFDAEGRLTDESTRDLVKRFLGAFAVWTRRLAPIAAVCVACLISACSHATAPGTTAPTPGAARPAAPPAPVPTQLTTGGPPSTFSRTTADLKVSRLIDVRDGMTKATLFRGVTDVLSAKYSIDVSDAKAGFLMTPWQASFSRSGMPDLRYRTRVVVRFVGEDWKQVLVRAEAQWQRDDEWDVGVDNALLDDVVNDVKAKIGKKPAG
jgi:chromate reductase, NAD(P)H dehydrogenase (quinone)